MNKERKIQVEKTETYTLCDRCGNEIKPYLGRKYEQKIHIFSIALCFTEYQQGEWTFDCCQDCASKIMESFKK